MKNIEGKSQEKATEKSEQCRDKKCPFHGNVSLRGRTFKGTVRKKMPTRIVLDFERTVYIKKYERYAKAKTKIHAHLPECIEKQIEIGDYVEIKECRPLSKLIHFIVVRKIRDKDQKIITKEKNKK